MPRRLDLRVDTPPVKRRVIRRVALVLALALVGAAPLSLGHPLQASAAGDTIDIPLPNAGFEDSAVGSPATSWANLLAPDAQIVVTDEHAYEGTQSLRIHADAGGGGYSRASSPLIPIEPGGSYEISAHVRTTGTNPLANIYARTVDSSGALISSTFSSAPQSKDQWNHVVHNFTAADDAAGVYIWLYIGSNAVGTHYFDQVSLTQSVPLTEAVVLNPGFESLGATGQPSQWRVSFAGSSGTIGIDTETVLSGQHSLRLNDVSATESLGLESTPFPIEAGETYRAVVNAYRVSGTPSVYLRFYNASGQVIESATSNINTPAGQWAVAVGDGTAPQGATTATVLLYSGSSMVSETYFDDISITASPVSTTLVGPQHFTVNAFTSAIGTRADGVVVGYVATYGTPARISEIDLATGTLLRETPLVGAAGVWGITVAPNGDVYAGTLTNGSLYRWSPSEGDAVLLGKPFATESYMTSLSAGDDGTIYGGTFPNARVFAYDPDAGSFNDAVTDFGIAAAGASYARSVKWHGGKVYIGTGTPAQLLELNPTDGSFRNIPLVGLLDGAEMIYGIESAGQYLTVRSEYPGELALLDPATDQWTAIGESSGLIASPPSDDDLIYFRDADGSLAAFNTQTGVITETSAAGVPNTRPMGWADLEIDEEPGESLVWFDVAGNLHRYNPAADAYTVTGANVPQTPAVIHSIGVGANGDVYSSAYVSGGLSVFDPATETTSPSGYSIGQIDTFFRDEETLWLGSYTRANIHELNTSAAGDLDLHKHIDLHAYRQDRIMALATLGDRVVIGTVAEYGVNGGALSVLDTTTTAEPEVYRDVIVDHAVVALAADTLSDRGVVYAGTTVDGGLGSTPTSTQGKVFAFDTESGAKLWEVDGAPGERAVTSLALDAHGTLWGIGVGTLFEMDPSDGTILRSKKLVDPADTTFVWMGTALDIGPDGYLYAFANRQAMRVDPVTLDVVPLIQGATAYAADFESGSLWFARSTDLYRADISAVLAETDYSSDSRLTSLLVDGTLIEGFDPELNEYEVTVGAGDAVPHVQAIASALGAHVEVVRGAGVPSTTTVIVRAPDGVSSSTYVIEFVADPDTPVPPSEPELHLSHLSPAAGQQITLTGEGFPAGASLEVELRSDPVTLAQVTADAEGAVSETVTIPADTEPGVHSIVVVGADGDLASVGITVLAADVEDEDGGEGNAGGAGDADSGEAGTGDGAGGLAGTGADVMPFVVVASLLLFAGALFFLPRLRREEV